MKKIVLTALILLAVTFMVAGVRAQADAPGDAEAQKEFESIMMQLEQKRNSMTMPQLIDLGERMLLEFIEKYPGTPASGNAHLTLGQIYASINRFDEATKHINAFFEGEFPKGDSEVNMARHTLGTIYISTGKFEEAEEQYRAIAAEGSGADQRMRGMAGMMLERMETLKRLVIGGKAIDFSATDTDGKKIALSDYIGKVVLLDFWATWCGPCRAEMPTVINVYKEYNPKGFEIIGVSLDNSREKLDTYVKEQNMPWRQIYDGKGWGAELGQVYAVSSIPATFLIDKQGVIRYKNLRGGELGEAVKELLAK